MSPLLHYATARLVTSPWNTCGSGSLIYSIQLSDTIIKKPLPYACRRRFERQHINSAKWRTDPHFDIHARLAYTQPYRTDCKAANARGRLLLVIQLVSNNSCRSRRNCSSAHRTKRSIITSVVWTRSVSPPPLSSLQWAFGRKDHRKWGILSGKAKKGL